MSSLLDRNPSCRLSTAPRIPLALASAAIVGALLAGSARAQCTEIGSFVSKDGSSNC